MTGSIRRTAVKNLKTHIDYARLYGCYSKQRRKADHSLASLKTSCLEGVNRKIKQMNEQPMAIVVLDTY